MDEIALLQQRLHDIQSGDELSRITDRVCVDLIDKIQHLFGLRLVRNTEGSEYITPEYLFRSIREEILERERMKTGEICEIFKVNLEKIEPVLAKITENNDNIIRVGDLYLTTVYFQTISEEINEDLQKCSSLSLSDLSLKYEIPISFLRKMLSDRIETRQIQGNLSNNELISLDFYSHICSKIKGALLGSSLPLSLVKLRETLEIHNGASWLENEENIREIIEGLIRKGDLDGRIDLWGYFHEGFFRKRDQNLLKMFLDNKFLRFETFKDFFIDNARKYLEESEHFQKRELFFFEEVVISKPFLLGFKEQIAAELESEGFVFLEKLLNLQFSENDCQELIGPGFLDLDANLAEIQGAFLFKKQEIDEIVKICKLKVRVLGKKGRKKGKKTTNGMSGMVEKEIERIPGVFYDNSAKKALIELINRKMEECSSENTENQANPSFQAFERTLQKMKNALDSFKFTFNCYQEANSSDFQMSRPLKGENLTDRLFNQGVTLLEISILFNFKRFETPIPASFLFIEDLSEINVFAEDCTIFKNKQLAEQAIELLPKNVGKLITEAKNMVLNEEFEDFVGFLEENEEEMYGEAIREGEGEEGNYHSPQKQRKKKLLHKKSRSTFC